MTDTIDVSDDISPDDPLALLAGIIDVPDPDAGDHHDLYFGADEADAGAGSIGERVQTGQEWSTNPSTCAIMQA